jgi:hypothetical protein
MSGFRDYSLEALERELRMDQIRADIRLKNAQAAAEWPTVLTAIIVAVAAIMGAAGALFGYSLRH